MKQYHHLASLYLRIALGATMLSAVADRPGFLGAPGEPGVGWETGRTLWPTRLI